MDQLLPVFKALGDETRFRLFQILLSHDLCVGALARHLGISNAAASQHLRVLREAGLVRGEKRGYWTHYAVDRDQLRQIGNRFVQLVGELSPVERTCLRIASAPRHTLKGEVLEMCKSCCEHPEKLKGKPEECTPEQIKECHGETKKHPCEGEKK
jgi:ArsR family transcriptional regulator